jgi:tyrosine-protein kinase Etk/Wzc
MNKEYNIVDLINQLIKWKKPLSKAIGAILILSVVGSLLLPNYYMAETIFYAASPDLAKPIPIGDDEKDVRIYGDDNDLDRLFTIATSQELLTYLIDTFNLYSHYDLDSTATKAKFKVKERLLDNFKTIKTKFGALHLIVEDKDPLMAAKIANAARDKIEDISQTIVKDSQRKLISSYEINITKKQVLSDSLSRDLERIKNRVGMFDSRTQTSVYTNLLAEATTSLEDAKGKVQFYKKYPAYRDSVIKYMALEASSNNRIAKATSELQKYAPVISEIRQKESEQGRLTDQISLDKERMKQLNATFGAPFSALHLVEKAVAPVQKSRPARSILVILSTLIGTILCILAVFIFENFSEMKPSRSTDN